MAKLSFSFESANSAQSFIDRIVLDLEIGGHTYKYSSLRNRSVGMTVPIVSTINPFYIPDNPILHNFEGKMVNIVLTSQTALRGIIKVRFAISPAYSVLAEALVNGRSEDLEIHAQREFSRRIIS